MVDLIADASIWDQFDALERELAGDIVFFRQTGSSQWTVLVRFIAIRNRLVPPKRHLDALVSDDDLRCIERADEMIHYLIAESLGGCSRALCKRLDEVQRVWLQRRASNHAMQPTAGRSDASLDITPTQRLQLMLAFASGG